MEKQSPPLLPPIATRYNSSGKLKWTAVKNPFTFGNISSSIDSSAQAPVAPPPEEEHPASEKEEEEEPPLLKEIEIAPRSSTLEIEAIPEQSPLVEEIEMDPQQEQKNQYQNLSPVKDCIQKTKTIQFLGRTTPINSHLAGLEFWRHLERDAEAREAFKCQVCEEKERRQALRQSHDVPDTPQELIEYFLDTEAQEIEFEIARMRLRLNEEFFAELKFELGQLRFSLNKKQAMEDRLIELEALEKAIQEGTEAYDKMQAELIKSRQSPDPGDKPSQLGEKFFGNPSRKFDIALWLLHSARKMIDEMPQVNVVSWIELIVAYSRSGNMNSAQNLFDENPLRPPFNIEGVDSTNVCYSGFCHFEEFDSSSESLSIIQLLGHPLCLIFISCCSFFIPLLFSIPFLGFKLALIDTNYQLAGGY